MVNYKCIRCGYTTNDKTKMKTHFNRKTVCKPKLNNINLDDYKERILNGENISFLENHAKTAENHAKNREKYAKTAENHAKNSDSNSYYEDSESIDTEDGLLVCQECGFKCESKDQLELHLKKKCKMSLSYNNIYKFNGKTLGKNIFKNKKNAGEIYIIQTDYMTEDVFKIGITRHISKRICQYRTANSYEPRLHYYFPCQDVKAIDKDLNNGLKKFNVKREIFKGDLGEIKECIVDIIKKKFNLKETKVIEPEIKLGDIRECRYCNKCFYESKELFRHFNTCTDYREFLNKKSNNTCKYCEKTYSSNSHLNRHLKTCKEKAKDEEEKQNLLKVIDVLNQQLIEQREQLNKRDHQIDELIKKAGNTQNNTLNTTNNIKILAYKNTDLSHLTDNDYLQCIGHSNFCVPHLIKKIHFNPKKPENHNVYISNIKNKYAMIYDGIKWNLSNQLEVIDDLLDTNHEILEQKLEEWLENGKDYPEIMTKFNRYLEKKEKDQVANNIKEEIKLMLFNNRTMVSDI